MKTLLKLTRLKQIKSIAFVVVFLFICQSLKAQNLDFLSKVTIVLNDGTNVTLYAKTTGSGRTATASNEYYYLPSQLVLSRDPATQVPNFLFLKYVTEESESQDGISGALMHFLMQSGYTKNQLTELQSKLEKKVSGAVVKGAVDLFTHDEGNSFTLVSATVNKDGGLAKSLVTSGRAPLYPGGKIAVATNLDKYGAQLMAATFEKTSSIADLSVTMLYKYYVRVNGLKADLVVDYEKIQTIFTNDRVFADYYPRTKGRSRDVQTWDELHRTYDYLVEHGGITIDIEQGFPSAMTDRLTEIFFQIFMDKFATPAPDQTAPPIAEKEAEELPGKTTAYRYYFNTTRIEQSILKKKETISLNYNFMLPMEFAITQNLKTFYNESKDNKNCVATVLLNDNFYKHMDIRFQLGTDALRLFELNELDLVTVDVRKRRNSGNDFTNTISFTKSDITNTGSVAAMTYAAGDDRNADMYQYRTQWSMRGGIKYPKNPQWVVGQMQASTLDLPIMVHNIEFEADPERLKELGISRAVMQVRYSKFGEEVEENISVTAAKNEPLASKTIFIDKDVRGYAYRMIFYHTKEGKLALPWSPKVNGSSSESYEYAVIPDELEDKTSEVFNKAIDAAKDIITAGPDGKVTAGKVLDNFKDILGVIRN